jgi:hypothetical protein
VTNNVKLNRAGIAAILKSGEMQALVAKAADEIAENVRGQGFTVGPLKGSGQIPLPVTVSTTVTDRAHASVILAHPAGIAVQAKHGALTRAASAAGLNVKGGA